MDRLEQLIAKKKQAGKSLGKPHVKAKSSVLQELMDDMVGLGASKLDGLKKVTVASDSPEGLKKGLEKAEEVVEQKLEGGEEESSSEEESEEECSPEELEAKIAELQKKLAELKA